MIREMITPNNEELVIHIPKEYVGKSLEILIFNKNEIYNKENDELLKRFNEITKKPVKIDSNIDVTKLDTDMYDDIF